MRMMRRAGLLGSSLEVPTLAELFADMTELNLAQGYSSDGSYIIIASLSGIDTSIPYYCFCSTGNNLEVSKIVGLTKTQLFLTGTRGVSVSSSDVYSGMVRGGSILLARFPSYKPKAIDKALSTMTVNVKASVYATTSAYCRFNYDNNPVNTQAMYISTSGHVGFSVSSGSSILTPVFSTDSFAFLAQGYTSSYGNYYGYSNNGSSIAYVWVASIFELLDAA